MGTGSIGSVACGVVAIISIFSETSSRVLVEI
jgi:hypothetical protein